MSLTQAPRLLEGMGAAEREKERTQRKEGVGHPPRLSRERAGSGLLAVGGTLDQI